MLFEWSEEKDGAIPREVVEALARGLFEVQGNVRPTLHPSEELLASLLSASANVRVAVPGIGEATLDRKSLKDLKSTMKDQTA